MRLLDSGIALLKRLYCTELYGEVQFNVNSFNITAMMHPATYLNKILLASQQGTLQLWNIRTRWVGLFLCVCVCTNDSYTLTHNYSNLIYTYKGWSSPVISVAQVSVYIIVPTVTIVTITCSHLQST